MAVENNPLETTIETPDVVPPSVEAPVEPELFAEPVAPVTPPVVEAPIAPVVEPVTPVAPVTPITPVVEPVVQEVTTPKEPIVTPITPEEPVLDTRQERIKEFNELVSSGARTEELADFARKNTDISRQMGISIKNTFQTKQNLDFNQKYATESPENLYAAVQRSEVIVGSKQYNNLPAETRQRFEAYKAQKDITALPAERKESLANDMPVIQGNVEQRPTFYSMNMTEAYTELMESPEIKAKQAELEPLNAELANLADDMEFIKEDIIKSAGNTPINLLRAEIGDAQREISRTYNRKRNTYNAKLATLQDLRKDAEIKLSALQYDNAQARLNYTDRLNEYNTNRARMDTFAIAEFEQENKLLAEQRQRDFQIEMAEFEIANKEITTRTALENSKELYSFQNQIAQGNVKGKWETRFDGLYFLEDNWNFEKKINGNVESSKDGVSIYTYVWEDGQPVVEYRDIKWETIWASTSGTNLNQKQVDLLNAPAWTIIPTRLWQTTNKNWGKECAEYINDIFADEIGQRMGSDYASKLAVANEKKGGVGSIAVWQPNPDGEFAKFWHAGVIVWESPDGKSWDIKSSNLNIDGTISVDRVPKDVIAGYKTTSLYNTPIEDKKYSTAQEEYLNNTSLEDFNSNKNIKETANSLWLSTEDVFAFKANNIDPKKKEELESVLSAISKVKNSGKWFLWRWDGISDALGFFSAARFLKNTNEDSPSLYLPWTDAADFEANFKSLESVLTIENLDLMTGILTDKDLEVLRGANTSLSLGMSEAAFREEMWKIELAVTDSLATLWWLDNNFFTDDSGKKWTKEGIADELSSLIDSWDMTEADVAEYIKENNIKFD